MTGKKKGDFDQAETFLVGMFLKSELMICSTAAEGEDWEQKHSEFIKRYSEEIVKPAWPCLSEYGRKALMAMIQKRIPGWRPE